MSNDQMTNWHQITSEEAFRLSQAEFKGMVMQALKDLRDDVKNLESYNSTSRYISMFIAGLSGIVSGLFGESMLRGGK